VKRGSKGARSSAKKGSKKGGSSKS
jgi:hypothetical protein